MQFRIVGTAGHIDHGKSALVRALTGVDPDRLREEKERGITIDLGFADARMNDHHVGFVDVPGHERFVKNMLAGIGGIDAVLFVVAADESIMPQTREHLAICELLGIRRGVVAITKVDLVDDEIAELVALEVAELLADTGLADAPIVHTSITGGAGLEELRDALAGVLGGAEGRPVDGVLRLPIDRVFTMRGFGTVVTGTLVSGRVQRGDRVEVLPGATGATVRGIQLHGQEAESAVAGQRTALNLQGVSVDDLARGMTLTTLGALQASWLIDVRLHALPGHEGFQQRQRVRFHHGSAEVLARVALLEGDTIEPGESGLAQLRLETTYPACPGDRFVLRRYSPVLTVGGGVVIDRPPRKRRANAATVSALRRLEKADLGERLEIHVADAGIAGTDMSTLAARTGAPRARVETLLAAGIDSRRLERDATGVVLAADRLEPLRGRVAVLLGEHHGRFPLRPAMPKEELRGALDPTPSPPVLDTILRPLIERGEVRLEADGYALAEHVPRPDAAQRELRDRMLSRYLEAGLTPPSNDEILAEIGGDPDAHREVLHFLLRSGDLLRVKDDLVVHADAMERLIRELGARFERGEQFSVGDFRDWAGVTRKHAIPLLEHLDASRVTRRVGDQRERV